MTNGYQAAAKKAKTTGGTVTWSSTGGYGVTSGRGRGAPGGGGYDPGYYYRGGIRTPTGGGRQATRPGGWPEQGGFQWPWQTPTGEGFISPWTSQQRVQTPQGIRYQQTRPGAPQFEGWWSPEAQSWLSPTGATRPGVFPTTGEPGVPPTGAATPEDIWGALGLTPPTDPLTYEEALRLQQQLGPQFIVDYDPTTGGYFPRHEPGPGGGGWPVQQQMQQQQLQQDWRIFEQQMEMQGRQLTWEREMFQQQMEAQRQQMLAQLQANPASWLQYAAAAGEEPAIQPWMLPLMPQQYQGLGAGEAIPGYAGAEEMMQGRQWSPETEAYEEAPTEMFTGMPGLLNPSAQLLARMGPTAQAQYQGYQLAQQGAPGAETQFRQWAARPPSGQFPGLRYAR